MDKDINRTSQFLPSHQMHDGQDRYRYEDPYAPRGPLDTPPRLRPLSRRPQTDDPLGEVKEPHETLERRREDAPPQRIVDAILQPSRARAEVAPDPPIERIDRQLERAVLLERGLGP